ncbi:MAG: transaldolase [Candidatus Rokubacteria bacterium]|nr:transaldolase [Candidatus Rokubacteria bacterium]
MARLVELERQGQSVWYHDLRRGLVASGALARLVADGVSGVTSNPTPAADVIGGSRDHDAPARALATEGKHPAEVAEALGVKDVRIAADVLRPVYDRTRGRDGFVSFEISPTLAHDASGTVAEAYRLLEAVGRPNVMINVPATPAGLWVIEHLVGEGISVNATLLFSLERYEAVAGAYLAGLERRLGAGHGVAGVASVASFFVSRVDAAVDRLLDAEIGVARSEAEARSLEALRGRAAVGCAKTAYAAFKTIFSGADWRRLARRGARVQRLLWASTEVERRALGDLHYVEALIGHDTVVALPPATLEAFRRHGRVRPTLEEDLPGARAVLRDLETAGISLERVGRNLEDDGLRAFAAASAPLLAPIITKPEKGVPGSAGSGPAGARRGSWW